MSRRAGRPHVLLLAFHFPPARGSGVYRIRAWANELVVRGLDVTVVTVDDAFYRDVTGEPEAALLATVDPRVRRAVFRFPHEYLQRDVASMSWAHANFGPAYLRLWNRLPEWFFPERYGHALPLMVARGLAVHARHRVDLVLASGNPFAQLGAAERLGSVLGVPYVVDYHDPWTLDPATSADRFPADHPAWGHEARIVGRAALVATVNPPLADWYRARYPQAAARVRVAENGVDPASLEGVGPRPADPGRRLSFGYVGTVRKDLPLEEFLAGWRMARGTAELGDADLTVHGHLGFFVGDDAALRHRLAVGADGEADGVSYRGPVPQPQLGRAYDAHDVLVLLLPPSPYVTGGKAYDLMASGRPVVSVYDPGNDTARVMAEYPLDVPVAAVTPEEVAGALRRAAATARHLDEPGFRAARAIGLRHAWRDQLGGVLDEVESLARSPSRV